VLPENMSIINRVLEIRTRIMSELRLDIIGCIVPKFTGENDTIQWLLQYFFIHENNS
jgi:hypothetical protein